jgi:hypothetical protein
MDDVYPRSSWWKHHMYMDAQRSLLLYDDLTLYLRYGVLTNDTKGAYLHASKKRR